MSPTSTRPSPGAVGDALAALGGGDRETLAKVPRARTGFLQMGLVLLTTATMATVSMAYALAHGLHTSWLVALPLALAWGFGVILTIDRFLVLTMGAVRSLKLALAIAVPRLLVALVLSAVVSTPLVLEVFRSDIQAELYSYHLEQSKLQAEKEKESKEQLEIDRLTTEIGVNEATLAGQLPTVATDPAIEEAKADASTQQNRVDGRRKGRDAAYEAWQCELYGKSCRGGSRKSGPGPLAEAKRRQYEEADQLYRSAQRELGRINERKAAAQAEAKSGRDAALASAQAVATAALPALRARLADLRAVVKTRTDEGRRLTARDNGLLAQLRALHRVGERDPALFVAHALVAALFLLIELLPVLAKLLLALGPMSAYETVLRSDDEVVKDRAAIDRAEARQIEEAKSQTRIALEGDMRNRELELGVEANEQVADQMSLAMQLAFDAYGAQCAAAFAAQGFGVTPVSPAGATPPVSAQSPTAKVNGALAKLSNGSVSGGGPTNGTGNSGTSSTGSAAKASSPVSTSPPVATNEEADDGYALPSGDLL